MLTCLADELLAGGAAEGAATNEAIDEATDVMTDGEVVDVEAEEATDNVAGEAAAGGVLALVKTGDEIVLSAKEGRLDLLVDEEELLARSAYMSTPLPDYERGYIKLYIDHVLGADKGADLDFLVGNDTRVPQRESH